MTGGGGGELAEEDPNDSIGETQELALKPPLKAKIQKEVDVDWLILITNSIRAHRHSFGNKLRHEALFPGSKSE